MGISYLFGFFRRYSWVGFVFVGFLLFFAYAWLPLSIDGIWNSPDETAVAYFADNIPVLVGDYDLVGAYSSELGGLVHPRSMGVLGGELVPGMWVGLPWILGVFGIVSGFGIEYLELLVPLVSVFAVFAWGGIVGKFFESKRIGVLSGLVLAVHPGWWYFTARGLHPNVVFVSLLIFGVYFWYVLAGKVIKCKDKWRHLMLFFGGISFGLALFVRANEALWLLPVLFFVLYISRKYPFSEIGVAVLGFLVPLFIMFFVHLGIYGSGFSSGYFAEFDLPPVVAGSGDVVHGGGLIENIFGYVFPFGVHERNIFDNVLDYHLFFFAFWSVFAVFGLISLLGEYEKMDEFYKRKYRFVAIVGGLVALYLFVVYGSWNFNDNPDPNVVTIGTSYIRYWLPVSVLMTGLVGYYFGREVDGWFGGYWRHFMVGLLALMVVFGYSQVYFAEDDGLFAVRAHLERGLEVREILLDEVGVDDIVIVDMADKILFPYRNVIVPLRDDSVYASLPVIVDVLEDRGNRLFYYGIRLPEKDLAYLTEEYLVDDELEIKKVLDVDENSLYLIDSYDD